MESINLSQTFISDKSLIIIGNEKAWNNVKFVNVEDCILLSKDGINYLIQKRIYTL